MKRYYQFFNVGTRRNPIWTEQYLDFDDERAEEVINQVLDDYFAVTVKEDNELPSIDMLPNILDQQEIIDLFNIDDTCDDMWDSEAMNEVWDCWIYQVAKELFLVYEKKYEKMLDKQNQI